MEHSYDIVMRENDFVLYRNNKPLLTPNGNETAHANARLLRMVINAEMLGGKAGLQPIALLQQVADAVAPLAQPFCFDKEAFLKGDPLFNNQLSESSALVAQALSDQPEMFDFVFLNSSSLASAMRAFFSKHMHEKPTDDFLQEAIAHLTIEEKVVLDALCREHAVGLLVHLLLVTGYLSVSEYVSSTIVLEIKQQPNGLNDFGFVAERTSFLTQNTLIATDFLTLCKENNKLSVIEEIIRRGEDGQTEFKSTLRWDLRQEKKSPDIEHASLKTICAFLNSEGGDLLIGVRDDGSIEGIETDQFDNDDRFLLHLWMLIKTSMGHEVTEWVKTSLQKFGERTVCRVNCKRAGKPVFLNHKGVEAFYVRVGPASNSLEIRTALKYIEEHF